jgi:hypothetical protein
MDRNEKGATVIAMERLELRREGERVPVCVRVFAPERAPNPTCRVELDGLPGTVDICGETPLHALALAVAFLQRRLQHQREDGWTVFLVDDDGQEAEWGALYGFEHLGSLARPSGESAPLRPHLVQLDQILGDLLCMRTVIERVYPDARHEIGAVTEILQRARKLRAQLEALAKAE